LEDLERSVLTNAVTVTGCNSTRLVGGHIRTIKGDGGAADKTTVAQNVLLIVFTRNAFVNRCNDALSALKHVQTKVIWAVLKLQLECACRLLVLNTEECSVQATVGTRNYITPISLRFCTIGRRITLAAIATAVLKSAGFFRSDVGAIVGHCLVCAAEHAAIAKAARELLLGNSRNINGIIKEKDCAVPTFKDIQGFF
jgi:hypothetical protein